MKKAMFEAMKELANEGTAITTEGWNGSNPSCFGEFVDANLEADKGTRKEKCRLAGEVFNAHANTLNRLWERANA
jgi:hypothetical protein